MNKIKNIPTAHQKNKHVKKARDIVENAVFVKRLCLLLRLLVFLCEAPKAAPDPVSGEVLMTLGGRHPPSGNRYEWALGVVSGSGCLVQPAIFFEPRPVPGYFSSRRRFRGYVFPGHFPGPPDPDFWPHWSSRALAEPLAKRPGAGRWAAAVPRCPMHGKLDQVC